MLASTLGICSHLLGLLLLLPVAASLPLAGAAGCPVRLLDIESRPASATDAGSTENKRAPEEGLRLAQSGLDYLAQQQSPIYMVPTLGVYRGGKSLLLNRLMGLRAPYPGGFGVGHSQQTFTRGIDICAEAVPDLGTVIWMDTEGLFSSEDARSFYGPKIFSLALLLSSSVVLNSVKVFNDQFFAFFGEQQQLARLLRQGLIAEGLPPDALLPANLSVFWVLQQPINFDGTGAASQAQLESFLGLPGDELRARVRRDFRHVPREVPIAANDVRLWRRLNELQDEELLPDYVNATAQLRETVLVSLGNARPWQAASTATFLRMYVGLVQTERFSTGLVKDAFEEAEIGNLCNPYGHTIATLAGDLPSSVLQATFDAAREGLAMQRAAAMEEFHFGTEWSQRLEQCLRGQEEELRRRSADLVLAQWRDAARAMAEGDDCFFLGRLVKLLREYAAAYGNVFDSQVQASAVDYASSLQRARLVECVRLRDFLWPVAPWIIGPVCALYLRGGVVRGFLSMLLHVVVLAGVYVVLQLLHQLPRCIDLDYPILRSHPILLDVVMRAPPLVPWATMAYSLGALGTARSAWKVVRCIIYISKPAGHGHMVNQMMGLELKLNALLARSEAASKHQLAAIALNASRQLDKGDAQAAAVTLLEGLCFVRDSAQEHHAFGGALGDARLQQRVRKLLQNFSGLPPEGPVPGRPRGSRDRACPRPDHDLVGHVAHGEWGKLAHELVTLFKRLTKAKPAKNPSLVAAALEPGSLSARPQRSPSPLRLPTLPEPPILDELPCERARGPEPQQVQGWGGSAAECCMSAAGRSGMPPAPGGLGAGGTSPGVLAEWRALPERGEDEEGEERGGNSEDRSPRDGGEGDRGDAEEEYDSELFADDEDSRRKMWCACRWQLLVVVMMVSLVCAVISTNGPWRVPSQGLMDSQA